MPQLLGEDAETILVTLIVLFFVVSILHMLRNRTRPPIVAPTDNVFIQRENGHVVALTGSQRRAVLEAFFSDTAKAITDQDKPHKQKKKRKQQPTKHRDGDVPVPAVEIPTHKHTTWQMYDSEQEDLDEDIERGCVTKKDAVGDDTNQISSTDDGCEMAISDDHGGFRRGGQPPLSATPSKQATIRSILRRNSIKAVVSTDTKQHEPTATHIVPTTVLSEETTPVENNGVDDDIDMSSVSYEPDGLFSTATRQTPNPDDNNNNDAVHGRGLAVETSYDGAHEITNNAEDNDSTSNAGESFGDLCDVSNEMLRNSFSIASPGSFATVTSEYTVDDESTTDNLCSICLCGYTPGDVLIVSKHCTHMFHQDCILSWLDRHEDCPVCRQMMMTEMELDQAMQTVVRPSLDRQPTPVIANTSTTTTAAPPRSHISSLSHSMVSAPIRHLPPRVTPQNRPR